MCRLLFVNFKESQSIKKILTSFAEMCEQSTDPSGDWQGDGWGVSWLNSDNEWQVFKSTNPVWEDIYQFKNLPESRVFLAHARSKSFQADIVNTDFNQPLINNYLAFAFNGSISGARIKVDGRFGAEKIFNLINNSKVPDLEQKITQTNELIQNNSEKINAMNVIVADQNQAIASCLHTGANPEYYDLHYCIAQNIQVICSQQITTVNNVDWLTLNNSLQLRISFF